jgi:hypothetical protein
VGISIEGVAARFTPERKSSVWLKDNDCSLECHAFSSGATLGLPILPRYRAALDGNQVTPCRSEAGPGLGQTARPLGPSARVSAARSGSTSVGAAAAVL